MASSTTIQAPARQTAPAQPAGKPARTVIKFTVDNLCWDVGGEAKKLDYVEDAVIEAFPTAGQPGQTATGQALAQASVDANGNAELELPANTGTFRIRVLAPFTSLAAVGPDFDPALATRNVGAAKKVSTWHVFRPFELDVTAANSAVSTFKVAPGFDKNGSVQAEGGKLRVRLMPVWVRGAHNTRGASVAEYIVVHRSAGNDVAKCVPSWAKIGPHYFICKDGQVCKMVMENHQAWHAGLYCKDTKNSWWRKGARGNCRSIGIELVNGDTWKEDPTTKSKHPPFTAAQYASLLELLRALIKKCGIRPWQIIGHTDVSPYDPERQHDPGFAFQWTKLEEAELGLKPDEGYLLTPEDYGGYFFVRRHGILQLGDDDRSRRFGGEQDPIGDRPELFRNFAATIQPPPFTRFQLRDQTTPRISVTSLPPAKSGGVLDPRERPRVTGNPISELQDDLIQIGYDLAGGAGIPRVTGAFDDNTRVCVRRFQQHFFTFDRNFASADGRVNRVTAEYIKMARKGLERVGAIPRA
jgi:N-acetyl-anhydromuramyl-L-alanine amidase AmpD